MEKWDADKNNELQDGSFFPEKSMKISPTPTS